MSSTSDPNRNSAIAGMTVFAIAAVQPGLFASEAGTDARQIGFRQADARAGEAPSHAEYLVAASPSWPQDEPMSSPAVEQFLQNHSLTGEFHLAMRQAHSAMGEEVTLRPTLVTDPDDGSAMVIVEVGASDFATGDRLLTEFCYRWWYDHIQELGHVLGFRLVPRGGD